MLKHQLLCLDEIGFTDWSEWSECSHTCGPGTHTRSRECSIADPGDSFCQGDTNQIGDCNLVPCPSMYYSYMRTAV